MSVISYLNARASAAVLASNERASITTSILTLQTRVASYFGSGVKRHFQFGSSTRGTILPRSMDMHSDIDYMIVFDETSLTPQSHLDRLRRFAEKYYATSEIHQSSPTMVLELNHIMFELVPAIDRWGTLHIPDGKGGWMATYPNDVNQALEDKNKRNSNLIKPTVRLLKYWNAVNGYPFGSFHLEKWFVDLWLLARANERDYLFSAFDQMSVSQSTQSAREKVLRATKLVAEVRNLEANGYSVAAESEVKRLIPAA